MSNDYGRIFGEPEVSKKLCKKKSNNMDRIHTVFDATLKIQNNYSGYPKILKFLQWLDYDVKNTSVFELH